MMCRFGADKSVCTFIDVIHCTDVTKTVEKDSTPYSLGSIAVWNSDQHLTSSTPNSPYPNSYTE